MEQEKPVWHNIASYGPRGEDRISDIDKKRTVARWVILGRPSQREKDGLPADKAGLCDMLGITTAQLGEWMEDDYVQEEMQRLYRLVWQRTTMEEAGRLAKLYFESLHDDPSAARWRLELERTGQIGKGGGVNVNVHANTQINETHMGIEVSGAKQHLLNLFKEQPEIKQKIVGVLTRSIQDGTSRNASGNGDISEAVIISGTGKADRGASGPTNGRASTGNSE